MKIKELYDTDGHTATEVLPEKKITEMVKEWGSKNYVPDMFIETGVFHTGNTYGIEKSLEVDTRTGKISINKYIPSQYDKESPFYISLVRMQEVDFLENDLMKETDLKVNLKKIEIINLLNNLEDFENIEKEYSPKTNTYAVDWFENQEFFNLKKFLVEGIGGIYIEYIHGYEIWITEELEIDYSAISDFYN